MKNEKQPVPLSKESRQTLISKPRPLPADADELLQWLERRWGRGTQRRRRGRKLRFF
jgi:hypothetical protein